MQKNSTHSLVRGRLKVSDWVSGKSVNDEKFHGYIEAVHTVNGVAKVKVTACDNERSVGRTIECFTSMLEALPQTELDEEGQWMNLIDLALSAYDKAWFLELTSRLKNVETDKVNKNKPFGDSFN